MGDDGVGPYALEVLEGRYEFPDGVSLVELGTPGPEFGHILLDWDRLIVIDSVKAKGEPGQVKLYDRETILSVATSQRMSPHDPSLRDALLTADFVGQGPREVVLVGVVPARVEMGTELSPEVQAALSEVESRILEILARWDIEPTRRLTDATDVWWSRQEDA